MHRAPGLGVLFLIWSMEKFPRIEANKEAETLIHELQAQHGDLVFHQSGGCCDGSSPMCFQKGDFIMGYSDVCLGEVCGVEFWMSQDQFEYWKHTHLTLGVVVGRGSSFSLEIPMGKRFMIHSRLLNQEELMNLEELRYRED
ncbi:MAG: hypothetical protein RLZZ155_1614 [Bacteroidota bacterium]|jgi:uncharacterized protein (DUF779 family)